MTGPIVSEDGPVLSCPVLDISLEVRELAIRPGSLPRGKARLEWKRPSINREENPSLAPTFASRKEATCARLRKHRVPAVGTACRYHPRNTAMKRLFVGTLVPCLVLAGSLGIRAQDTPGKTKEPTDEASRPKAELSSITPAERYRDVLKAYQKAEEAFMTAYRAAKTNDERKKVLETKRPDANSYAVKMLKIAADAPKDPVAIEALIWAAINSYGPQAEKAMQILIADHVENPGISSLCARMAYDNSPQSEKFLREVLARNPGLEAQGQACLALGQRLKNQSEETAAKEKGESLIKEAESLLERVTKEFANIKLPRGTSGEVARNVLNEIRHLGIGKTAPEVSGEDIGGRAMKLSDFRGKVVVLDFWGDW